MSLLLVGIRSPDHAANLRYAEALTQKLRALPPTVVNAGDLRRPGPAGLLRDEQVALRLGGRPRVDPRSPAQRDQPSARTRSSSRSTTTSRSTRCRSASSAHDGLDERFPGGLFSSTNGEYVWIAALPPGGLFVEHAGEALYNAAHELIDERSAHPLPPADDAPRSPGPVATAHRHPPGGRATTSCRSPSPACCWWSLSIGLYFRRLRAIPLTGIPAAIGAVDRLRGRRPGVRLPELVDGVPGVDHPRQRHQLRDRPDVALRGAARARRAIPMRRCARRWPGVWRGTLVASISASAAYASLMVTSFRGFYQFGVMGAVGVAGLLAGDVHRRCRRCSSSSTAAPARLARRERAAHRISARWRASWRGARGR